MVRKAWSEQYCLENACSLLSDPFFVASEGVWREQQKQQRTLKQGGENLINQHFRRGHSTVTEELHLLKSKSTWSQLTDFLGETSQLTLNSTWRDGQFCAFLFFRR